MAYTLDISLALGGTKTGLTVAAQLVGATGANVGSEVTTGFAEIGNGNYLWHYTAFPDGHRGGVKFYESGLPGTVLAFCAVNPEEAENTNAKVSAIDTVLTAAHGSGSWLRDGGAGATAVTYTVTDSATGFGVAGVNVRMTTDEEGANTIARGVTDSEGNIVLYHDLPSDTTVYVFRQKSGWSFVNPDTEVTV